VKSATATISIEEFPALPELTPEVEIAEATLDQLGARERQLAVRSGCSSQMRNLATATPLTDLWNRHVLRDAFSKSSVVRASSARSGCLSIVVVDVLGMTSHQ